MDVMVSPDGYRVERILVQKSLSRPAREMHASGKARELLRRGLRQRRGGRPARRPGLAGAQATLGLWSPHSLS